MSLRRRSLLGASAMAPLVGCGRREAHGLVGGWVGAQHQRGHRLRDNVSMATTAAPVPRRADVLIAGAGIAGLAAARVLHQAGIAEVHLFDLEDEPGGNSRGHVLGGMACPLGAHYLPVPGDDAVEVLALLEELGLRRRRGSPAIDEERHLAHSPQERLFVAGVWHEGLLPPIDALPAAERVETLAQYRRFGMTVAALRRETSFSIPTSRAHWSPTLQALDSVTFARWLDGQGLHAPALRWYLDYCCRDDYGAGPARVSAWAGLHYFASRHGFAAPGEGGAERDGVFTWPEGNAWLSRRMATPLGERFHGGCIVHRARVGRHEVEVDLWNTAAGRAERWTAGHVVLALPLFVAARLLDPAPPALRQAASALRYAPWLVANLQLREALTDTGGAAPAWDNVVYGSPALGYVDAMHQSTRPHPGPTVLTHYWALGGDSQAQGQAQRDRLLHEPWSAWADAVLRDLARAHPDLPGKLVQMDLMRHGHAMSIPLPGVRSHAALQALTRDQGRVHFAHSDLSGYSIFEEALYHGHRAGRHVAKALRRG